MAVVDQSLDTKDRELQKATSASSVDYDRLDANRRESIIRDDLYSEQVKRQQLHNELSGELCSHESIVRPD